MGSISGTTRISFLPGSGKHFHFFYDKQCLTTPQKKKSRGVKSGAEWEWEVGRPNCELVQ